MAEEYHGLHEKLVDRFGAKGDALYIFFAYLLALGVSGLAAYAFKQPLLSRAWVRRRYSSLSSLWPSPIAGLVVWIVGERWLRSKTPHIIS